MPTLRPDSPTGLYWSIHGSVLCPEHIKDLEEGRWISEGWEPLPRSSQGAEGHHYQCQRCSRDGTALAPRFSNRGTSELSG
jgi:hypothetical protein